MSPLETTPSITAIAAGSKYDLTSPDQRVRFSLAQQFVQKAVKRGYAVFITDNSSNPAVTQQLEECGALVETISNPKQATLGRAESLEAALKAGKKYILLTELEKVDLLRFLPEMVVFMQKNTLDILVTGRTEASFTTHPENMQATEPVGNRQMNEATGLHFDWLMGSHLLSQKAANLYADLHRLPTTPWVGGQMLALATAIKQGLRAAPYIVEGYRYPPTQCRNETNNPAMDAKRKQLLRDIVNTVITSWQKN